jgi:hypothetical protein
LKRTRADVGHVEALEEALDDPVLAERPVEGWEDNVATEQAHGGRQRQLATVRQPAPVTRDLDGNDAVTSRFEPFADRRGRRE